MRLSHSKLSCILSCPMTYYLKYKQGIKVKASKPALQIGSNVHWGLEHSTSDLRQYFADSKQLQTNMPYGREQVLAEAMVHGYLCKKNELFDSILTNPKDGSKLKLIEEVHELELAGDLKSYSFADPNSFFGIIDLLLIVEDEAGQQYIIILDYKTSSMEPDWDDYLNQIYRYIFLVKSNFPDIPVLKIGIINLIKSSTKWLRNENESSFARRLRTEYELSKSLITYHEYDAAKLDKQAIDDYILNLSRQADAAACIDLNNAFYINYDNAVTKYGKSDYYDIFYHVDYAHVLYTISDNIYDASTGKVITRRDCKPLDMLVIDHFNVLNKYEQFKAQALAYYAMHEDINQQAFFNELRKQYIVDDDLLIQYWNTLMHEFGETTN